jgi:DNA modification methylase
MSARLIRGDCVEVMRAMPDESVDAIVCDPPYGLEFMGKDWDRLDGAGVGSTASDSDLFALQRGGSLPFGGGGNRVAYGKRPGLPMQQWHARWATEALRVLKPGGHLVAFGGSRTVHRLTCAIEDAEFEIRDMGIWQFYSGFPKSLDVSKAIDRAAGAERNVVGERPGTYPKKEGTWSMAGDLANKAAGERFVSEITAPATPEAAAWSGFGTALKPAHEPWILARKPLIGTVAANVLAHGTGALNVDACRYAPGDPAWPGPGDKPTGYPNGPGGKSHHYSSDKRSADVRPDAWESTALGRWPANVYACPKASRSEREQGCEGLVALDAFQATGREPGSAGMNSPRAGIRAGAVGRRTAEEADSIRNVHPTVKPLRLMRWLSRLVGGKPGSVILDPFLGSGTTGCAALVEGFDFIGIEREPDYLRIAEARIRHAARELGGGDTVDLFRRVPSVVIEGLDP